MTTNPACVRCAGQDPNCLACPKPSAAPLSMSAILKTPAPPPPAPKIPRNEVIFVLDGSGSMTSCFDVAKKKLIEAIKAAGEESTKIGQVTSVSVCQFGASFRWIAESATPETAAQRVGDMHQFGGGTPLNKALINATDKACSVEQARDAILFVIITDGENTDSYPTYEEVATAVRARLATGKYTFAFLGPPRSTWQIKKNYAAVEGNIEEWENTAAGAELAGQTLGASTRAYYSSTRASGQTMSTQFITKVTDLSQVKESDLAKKLHDVTNLYKPYTVSKQETIAPFVSDKTKRPYKLGDAFFQLMKTERVQATKEIAVMVKTGPDAGKLYTGPEVRNVLGLPQGNTRLKPGNHSNYEIFVQSTSLNRILPLGTKVMVKKNA